MQLESLVQHHQQVRGCLEYEMHALEQRKEELELELHQVCGRGRAGQRAWPVSLKLRFRGGFRAGQGREGQGRASSGQARPVSGQGGHQGH
jgi:hypothetical protein